MSEAKINIKCYGSTIVYVHTFMYSIRGGSTVNISPPALATLAQPMRESAVLRGGAVLVAPPCTAFVQACSFAVGSSGKEEPAVLCLT